MTGERHNFTLKRKQLAASMLAQKIGYLKVQDFIRLSFFDSLPTQEFASHRVIRPHDQLFVVRAGIVEIWHSHHDILVNELGPRLGLLETEHYRAAFQTVDSRVATLLLELADAASTVEGYTQEDLAEQVSAYRESVANAIRQMKANGFIEVDRKSIRLVDKRALRELSDL